MNNDNPRIKSAFKLYYRSKTDIDPKLQFHKHWIFLRYIDDEEEAFATYRYKINGRVGSIFDYKLEQISVVAISCED